jgi:hypothetical protein
VVSAVRQLLAVFTATMLAISMVAAGAAAPALNGDDRQVVLQFNKWVEALERRTQEVTPRVKSEVLASARKCPGFNRDKTVAASMVFAVRVLNTGHRMRGQIKSFWVFVRTQRFSDPVLSRWLASMKMSVTLGERSGILNGYVSSRRLCVISDRVYRLLAAGELSRADVTNKVNEFAGLNMRLLRASARTTMARRAMRSEVEPLFRSAGLSETAADRLADF